MARNTNVRCIRVSEEMDELINQQIGDTYTAKFTNLVTRCIWELPAKEAELKRIEKLIREERNRLNRIVQYRQELERNAHNMNLNLQRALNQINQGLDCLHKLIDKT